MEIVNAAEKSWNGKRGVVGGYLADSKKRVLFLTDQDGREVAVASETMCLVEEGASSVQPLPPLTDIPDRMGMVCLHAS